MSYSFTQIERNKTKTIGLVFGFLIVFYFISTWLIVLCVKNYFFYTLKDQSCVLLDDALIPGYCHPPSFFLSTQETLMVLAVSFFIALIHWWMSTADLIPKILRILQAEPLREDDTYHQTFQNILDEVSIATGGRKMKGVVVPVSAMNAFALEDFSGLAVIGITEGALARLNRAQIEAVVGHEAAHIASGDCLAATVTTSLAELYSGLLRGLEVLFKNSDSSSYRSRSSSRFPGIIILVYVLLWITNFLSQLIRMFISRERENRADAVAIRLTRDPLSLAEALYSIAFRWRGAGLASQELESIFIVNPRFSRLDEQQGFLSNLFSTHPPIKSRLNILLDMAHLNLKDLEKELLEKAQKSRQEVPLANKVKGEEWLLHRNGQWLGPFNFEQVLGLGWVKPDTWSKRLGVEGIKPVFEDVSLTTLFRTSSVSSQGSLACPHCHVPLIQVNYEGIQIFKCASCEGSLVQENDVMRIFIRQDIGFSEHVVRLANLIREKQEKYMIPQIDLKTANLFMCPKCQFVRDRMIRKFYSPAYPIEVDKCWSCGMVWFDKDELEILQYLIEDVEKKKQIG